MKHKIIFVTGLANGGKTTTLKKLIHKFKKDYLRAKITINSVQYHVRDGSNCDYSWINYQERVKKYSHNKNFIYPLCLDLSYHENTACMLDILNFLTSLTETHELHFFVLVNGAQDRRIQEQYLNEIRNSFSNITIFDHSQADMSNELLEYLQNFK